jgi:hypothetical protein
VGLFVGSPKQEMLFQNSMLSFGQSQHQTIRG